jgi:hypothetical protein
MLVHRRVDVETYTTLALGELAVLDVAARVEYEVKAFETYPAALPGGVEIRLRSGETFTTELEDQRDRPTNPLTETDIRDKFTSNASRALPQEDAERLLAAVLSVDNDDLPVAFAALRFARAALEEVVSTGLASL